MSVTCSDKRGQMQKLIRATCPLMPERGKNTAAATGLYGEGLKWQRLAQIYYRLKQDTCSPRETDPGLQHSQQCQAAQVSRKV